LPARVRADIVADQDNHAASLWRGLEKDIRGHEDPVIDICRAACLERADFLGNPGLSLLSGSRNSASVEKVNSATVSSGLSAASVVAPRRAKAPGKDRSNRSGPAPEQH